MADVELASGSLSALKNAGEYAYVEIDWSKAKVVEFGRGDKVEKSFGTIDQYNKSQGADWVKDWPAVKQDILNFTAWKKYPTRPCFNKKNKKGTLITVNPAVWKSKSSDKDLILIDGYPRSVEQMTELDKVLVANDDVELAGVIEVDVSEDTARARVLGRARGADDNNEVFNNRMKVYLDPIEAIRGFYGEKGLLHRINGERTIEEIVADMKNLLSNLK